MAAPKLPSLPNVISDIDMVRRLVAVFLQRGEPVSFDIETTGLDPRSDCLVSIQLQQGPRPVCVIDCRGLDTQMTYDDRQELGQALARLFDGSVLIVGHNLKFDLGFMRQHFGISAKRVYDTMLAEQIIHGVGKSDARVQGVGLTLKSLAASYDAGEMSKEERNWFIDLDERNEWHAPFPDEQLAYMAMDVDVLRLIMREQSQKLAERHLIDVARLEMRCLPALVEVEHAGVYIDREGWEAFIREKEAEAADLATKALETFGPPILWVRQQEYDTALMMWEAWDAARITAEHGFRTTWDELRESTGFASWGSYKNANLKLWRMGNPNPGKPKADLSLPNLGSTKQLLAAFQVLEIPATNTKAETLKQLEDDYPPIKVLTDWRRAEKFVTSFGESLLQFIGPDGRIHPEYVQIGASTGRMACSRPNWQQVPSKGDGARLRGLVKAASGHSILTADFSNIELRILADMSGDLRMLESFASGLDLHSYTARMMFDLDEYNVDVKHECPFPGVTYRAVAKTINFGLVYGMSATKLGKTLKISREKALELFDAYFSLYPGVQKWLENTRAEGMDQMTSITYAGRKRYYHLPAEPVRPFTRDVDEINQWQEKRQAWKGLKHRIERQACNTPVQGTSADITKLALALFHESCNREGVRVIAIVHDELVVETPDELADQVSRLLAQSMEQAAATYLHTVTLPPVEVAVSDHWSKE